MEDTTTLLSFEEDGRWGRVASATRSLYASSVIFLSLAVLFVSSDRFRAQILGLDGHQLLAAGLAVFFLAFPLGYLINALSYFALNFVIDALFKWIYRNPHRFLLQGFMRDFETELISKEYEIGSASDLIERHSLLENVAALAPRLYPKAPQREALAIFSRNIAFVCLLPLLLNLYLGARAAICGCLEGSWSEHVLLSVAWLVATLAFLFTATLIYFYITFSSLKTVYDLERALNLFTASVSSEGAGSEGADLAIVDDAAAGQPVRGERFLKCLSRLLKLQLRDSEGDQVLASAIRELAQTLDRTSPH